MGGNEENWNRYMYRNREREQDWTYSESSIIALSPWRSSDRKLRLDLTLDQDERYRDRDAAGGIHGRNWTAFELDVLNQNCTCWRYTQCRIHTILFCGQSWSFGQFLASLTTRRAGLKSKRLMFWKYSVILPKWKCALSKAIIFIKNRTRILEIVHPANACLNCTQKIGITEIWDCSTVVTFRAIRLMFSLPPVRCKFNRNKNIRTNRIILFVEICRNFEEYHCWFALKSKSFLKTAPRAQFTWGPKTFVVGFLKTRNVRVAHLRVSNLALPS